MCNYKMIQSVRNLHTMLFIVFVCAVQNMSLVCPYNDTACYFCDKSWVNCKGLSQIPPIITGANVIPVKHVSISHGNITSISKNDLLPGLKSIHLEDCPLTNISEDAFDASAETLERIEFTKAKFNKLPTALKKLKKLKHFSVIDTPIQVWDTAILTHIGTTVDKLELRNVSLSSWPSWISNFISLKDLDVSWNSLKSIPDNAFSPIKNQLTNLMLSSTGLTNVPKAVSTLSSLNSLILSNNSLTNASELETITQSPFASKISKLNLNSVGLDRIVNFSKLTNLSSLDLTDNKISDVPAGSLPTSIKILLLKNNLLTSVPKDLAVMTKLELLDLENNLISAIEPNSFPSSLTFLDLKFNKLTAITDNAFKNLKFLESLALRSNPISTIAPSAFSDLVSLSYLSINSSRLTEIPLALTALKPDIRIFFITNQAMSCTCPAPPTLVQWFHLLTRIWVFLAYCSNGQSVKTYLSDKCETG